jgi:hypothetical protein
VEWLNLQIIAESGRPGNRPAAISAGFSDVFLYMANIFLYIYFHNQEPGG